VDQFFKQKIIIVIIAFRVHYNFLLKKLIHTAITTAMSLGARINQLPREMQREIIVYIDSVSMAILRHVIYGKTIPWNRLSNTATIYRSGIKFFTWVYCDTAAMIDYFKAAEFGDPDIVRFLIAHHNENRTAESHELDYASHTSDNRVICSGLASGGHLELLQYARSQKCPWGNTCSAAASKGHLRILQWVTSVADGCRMDSSTSYWAVESGNLELLKWAYENGCPWDPYICIRAAKRGNLDMLIWAISTGHQWDEEACAYAAMNGHLNILVWVKSMNLPMGSSVCDRAAQGGHLDILKWAHNNGCPWNADTIANAALNRRYEIVQWALDNGCPFDSRLCYHAFNHGRKDIIELAESKGCMCNGRGSQN
jgi:hypothetical protein